jgi:D-sedoheptulose 7-phosphate isomerase
VKQPSSFYSALEDLCSRYRDLSFLEADLRSSFDMLTSAFRSSNKLLVCGNGGSASDAEHIVGELVKSFAFHRPVEASLLKAIDDVSGRGDEFASSLEGSLPAISLMSPVALNSAFGNDRDFNFAIAQQVLGLGVSGDVFLGISTSGNSKNVVNGAIVAKAKGLKVIGLTGKSGGKLAEYCDVCIKVPASETHIIQEYHLPIYHMLCYALESEFFGKYGAKSVVEKPMVNETVTRKKLARKNIDLMIFDFDGVFTDNKVITDQNGKESVVCSRGDGLGIDMLRSNEIPMFILSTESNPVVAARANKLKIEYKHSCSNKKEFVSSLLKEKGIEPEKVLFIGNDLNDKEAMSMVEYRVCPSDSHPDILKISNLVLQSKGGQGAVRELAELICSES